MTSREHYRVNLMFINKIDMICFVYRGQLVQLHVCLHRATQVLATGVVEYFVLFLVTEKLRSGNRIVIEVKLSQLISALATQRAAFQTAKPITFEIWKIILCFYITVQLHWVDLVDLTAA